MRTTITLDADTTALLARLMEERGWTLKRAVNYAIRAGLSGRQGDETFHTPVLHLGEPAVPLEKALRLAGELEDEQLLDRLALRK